MIFLVFYFTSIGWAAFDPSVEATKLQSDLESALSRILPKDHYIVQVTASTETVSERKLIEGESVVQNNGANEVVVPPLPGFTPTAEQAQKSPPSQTRQVYKMVDKEILKFLDVQVTLDDVLDREMIERAKKYTQSFISASYGSKAKLTFHQITMAIQNDSFIGRDDFFKWLPWGILGIVLTVAGLLWLLRRKEKPRTVYPSVYSGRSDESEVIDGDFKEGKKTTSENLSRSLAFPSGALPPPKAGTHTAKYPALPASENFVDRRYELLQALLKNANIFRMYFERLDEAARLELYVALRGPAFDSLLDTLGLTVPLGADNLSPPTEDQMLFYLKNFNEFIHANIWQNEQFFGFLRQLSTEHLLTLVRQENPLVGALLLKSTKPEHSAAVLKLMSSDERMRILEHSSRVGNISSEELLSIEEKIRIAVGKLPSFLISHDSEELAYWTNILTHVDDQEDLLIDLEKTRPELYQKLSKYRFKLEDVPSLPQPLIGKVLSEVENDELAMALLTCPQEIVEYVLSELQPNRRALLNSQLTMYNGLPIEKLKTARQALTQKFREVMV